MKKLFILIMLTAITAIYAETLTLDTQIGEYLNASQTNQLYRDTSIILNEGILPVGLKLNQKVLNGAGITGINNNYRIGLKAFKELGLLDKLYFTPSLGGSLTSSDFVSNSISADIGAILIYKIPIFGLLTPLIGADILFYSDSTQTEYSGGFKINILKSLDLDLLYTGLFINPDYLNGFGVKLSFSF